MLTIKNYTNTKISCHQVNSWVEQISRQIGLKDYQISVVFVGQKRMSRLNQSYRGNSGATDVLSFIYHYQGGQLEGDIIVYADYLKRQAKKYNHSFKEELKKNIIHAMLHLVGYEHKLDKDYKIMRAKERDLERNIK